jgi:hypothetical protein
MPTPSRLLAFVDLADERGRPSIGDAIVMMFRLGVRSLDWLSWLATVFDRDLLAFRQRKPAIPLVLPWSKRVKALARLHLSHGAPGTPK